MVGSSHELCLCLSLELGLLEGELELGPVLAAQEPAHSSLQPHCCLAECALTQPLDVLVELLTRRGGRGEEGEVEEDEGGRTKRKERRGSMEWRRRRRMRKEEEEEEGV